MELIGALYAMIFSIKPQLMYFADRLTLLGALKALQILQACLKIEDKTF
jgi:hypothetical protein